MKPSDEHKRHRCRRNVAAWLHHHGVIAMPPWREEVDRCFFRRDEHTLRQLRVLEARGVLEHRWAGNHGKDIYMAFRECVPRCAAQVIVHADEIEVDFDLWQPWDVVGWIGHGWEVMTNRLRKRKTDPFRVAEMLRKRGINA